MMPISNSFFMPIQQFPTTTPGFYAYIIQNRKTNPPLHHHDFFQVFFVVKGHIILQADGIDNEIGEAEALIIPFDFPHRILFNPESVVYSLYFVEDYILSQIHSRVVGQLISAIKLDHKINSNHHMRLIVPINPDDMQNYLALFECLLRSVELDGSNEYSLAPSLITSCLHIIAKTYLNMPSGQKLSLALEQYAETVKQCIHFLDRNYSKNFDIDQMAKDFAISKTLLYSLFSQLTGTTINQYISKKRIQSAANLLLMSNMSIQEISEMVGYPEYSTFYRNFRKIVGKTPNEFRRFDS